MKNDDLSNFGNKQQRMGTKLVSCLTTKQQLKCGDTSYPER